MTLAQYSGRAALQCNAGHEHLGAARRARRTLSHCRVLNEQNYKRARGHSLVKPCALPDCMRRTSLMQIKPSARGNQLAPAPFKGGASAYGKKSLTKTDKRSRRRRVRGRKYFRLLAELLRLSKYHESISRPLTLLRCFGEVDVRCAEGGADQCTPKSAIIMWDAPRTDQLPGGCSPVL